MEFASVVGRRRMVRSFSEGPLICGRQDRAVVDDLLEIARRGPSAGNTAAVEFLVLTGDETEHYWSTTMTAAKRASFGHPGLFRAPVLVVVVTRPEAYAERYAEPDKARSGLGDGPEAWSVPYWWVDAGAVVQNLLLAVTDQGLGACLFGLFDHEDPVRARFGIPLDRRLVGTVAIGQPATEERPGRSSSRPRPALDQIRHWGQWAQRAPCADDAGRPSTPTTD